mmetsp:Transcript_37658/g.117349  ORF Transcript_37658/g.117349 Transcript_37658/m.117349 type:complete len:237 (-) Transcript_37658:93-803(-)
MRSSTEPCSMTKTASSLKTVCSSLMEAEIRVISCDRWPALSSMDSKSCIWASLNPTSSPPSSMPRPPLGWESPHCCFRRSLRYSFCDWRNVCESCCSCVASFRCMFFRSSRSRSVSSTPAPRVLTWWICCSQRRMMAGTRAEIASTSVSSPNTLIFLFSCALVSSLSSARMASTSFCASFAHSIHCGGIEVISTDTSPLTGRGSASHPRSRWPCCTASPKGCLLPAPPRALSRARV